ncbi:MAG: (4Fe-4S)-binding protein [Gaiellales bacterium]
MGNVFIEIDADVCIGIGKCEELEPNAVDLGDDGVSRPREGIALPRERAEKIVKRCPSGAISIVADAPEDARVADPA